MYSEEDAHTQHLTKRQKITDPCLDRATDIAVPSRYSSPTARTQNNSTKLRRPKHRVRIPKANDKVSTNDRPSSVGNVIPGTATDQSSNSNYTLEASSYDKLYGEHNTGVGLVTVRRKNFKTAVFSPKSSIPSDDAYFLTQRSDAISMLENFDSAQQTLNITAVDDLSVSKNAIGNHISFRNVGAESTPLSASPLPPRLTSSEKRTEDDLFSRPISESHAKDSANLEDLLVDLPSDAFASSPDTPSFAAVHLAHPQDGSKEPLAIAGLSRRITSTSDSQLRQLTLDGLPARNRPPQVNVSSRHKWPVTYEDEKPTHHIINEEAMRTWIYPTNLGTIRDYQFNIVARALYHNLLVALPTGLGKTFIAATVMLNWFRWTQSAQIIFVAPTKPLVAQQVESCFGVAGIPKSQTSLLTGGVSPGLRAEAWATKRVFFLTPQTIMNDLKTGICDPKRIVLLVVDEAHRATGGYAYVELVRFLHRFNQSFRVLALTATPGSSVESVQAVIDGLSISRVEIRTESSLDLQKYVYARRSDTVLLDNSPEMEYIMDLFSRSLQPVVNKLCQLNAYYTRDPMRLNAFGLTQARQRWMTSDAGRHASMSLKAMANNIFTILASLAHSIDLLKYHGLVPFYNNIRRFQSQHSSSSGKAVKEILDSDSFKNMASKLHAWTSQPDFIGHPKLEHLQEVVLNHFLDCKHGRDRAVDQSSSAPTRVMIFAQFRGSAEEIVRVLSRHSPIIRPHVFVGQAAGKTSEGMDQKRQLEIIKNYKQGALNTLVATSIGEEGLDIGEIDLIVCYDSSASPIRMLQRAGRTGRKRAGRITLLLMNGKEADSFKQAKDNYEKMQAMIASGSRFKFHDSRSPRIVPRHIKPEVDRRDIEIPAENYCAELPEPRARGKAPKRPAKQFHMPEGVPTGFTDASNITERADVQTLVNHRKGVPKPVAHVSGALEHIPRLIDVVLTESEEADFEHRYLHVANDDVSLVHHPRMTAYPAQQRKLGPIGRMGHAQGTFKIVQTLSRIQMAKSQDFTDDRAMTGKKDLEHLCGPDQSLRGDTYGSKRRSSKQSTR